MTDRQGLEVSDFIVRRVNGRNYTYKLMRPEEDVILVAKKVAGIHLSVDLKRPNKKQDYVFARQLVFYYLLTKPKKYSQKEAGMVFLRDHVTASYGRDRIRRLHETKDSLYLPKIERFCDLMNIEIN